MIDPLWRHALGAWRRDLVAALAMSAATVLLVAAVTTGTLVVAASGQAALETAFESAPTAARAAGAPSVLVAPASDGQIAERLRSRLANLPGFTDPARRLVSLRYRIDRGSGAIRPVVRREATTAAAVLFHESGAVEGLEVIAGPDPNGDVWVSDVVADRLDLEPGDELEVGFDPVGTAASRTAATTRVAGVYATVDGRPSGPLSDPAADLPPDPDDLSRPAELVLADLETVQRLGDEIEDQQFDSWRAAPLDAPRIEEMREASRALVALREDLYDTTSPLGALIFERYDGSVISLATGLPGLVRGASDTAEAVEGRVRTATWTGIVLALGALAGAAATYARRRDDVLQLEVIQGASPSEIAWRGLLEAALPLIVGGVGGRMLMPAAARALLPGSRLPLPALEALTNLTVSALALGGLAVLVVRGGDAWRRQARLAGDAERMPSVPLAGLVTTAAAVAVIGTLLGGARPATDPLAVALPLLVLAAVGGVGLRAVMQLLPAAKRPRRGPSAVWLASRRLTGGSRQLVLLGTLLVVAVGMATHVLVLRASVADVVEDKAISMAGARTVLAPPSPADAPDGVPGTATIVFRDRSVALQPGNRRVTLLAIDPLTFADAASWPSGASPSLVDALNVDSGGATAPVLAVGFDRLSDSGTLERFGWWTIPYEVVARPPAFPGVDEVGGPMLVMSKAEIFSRFPGVDPARIDSSGDPDGPWRTEVWTTADRADVLTALTLPSGELPLAARVDRSIDETLALPVFVSVRWGLTVLGALSAVVVVLAAIVVIVARPRGAAQSAVEFEFLRRLGVPSALQLRALLLERVGIVIVAAAIGVVIGAGLALVLADGSDPAPDIVPVLTPVVPVALILAVAVGLSVAAVVSALADHRATRQADLEESLRVAR